jgi:hypothetical protein
MRRMLWAGVVLLLSAQMVFGQDEPKPDQLKKMYDDALVQLKQAQDRKNELAAENEKLQKQLDAAKAREDELNRDAATFSQRTFFLRSQQAAWQQFIRHYPKIQAAWDLYLRGDVLTPQEQKEYIDPDWPLSAGT